MVREYTGLDYKQRKLVGCDKREGGVEKVETRDHDKVEEIKVREPDGDLEEHIATEGFKRRGS